MRIWVYPNVCCLDRLLSVPQIDLSVRADRKMVIFMSICVISQRNHDFTRGGTRPNLRAFLGLQADPDPKASSRVP